MVWVVLIRQNLTACDTVFRGKETQRTLSEHVFTTEDEALKFYNSGKASLKFAGLAGQYYTYPQQYESYQVHTHTCDYCNERFSLDDNGDLGFTDLGGDFCSRSCFRNNFQESQQGRNVYGEGVFDDHYYEDGE